MGIRHLQIRRIVGDSGDVEKGHRMLGKIRAFFYIGAGLLLVVVYFLSQHR